MRGLAGLSVIAFASLNLSVPARALRRIASRSSSHAGSRRRQFTAPRRRKTRSARALPRAGQTARLRITGNNIIISVLGVGDARDSWTFTTKAQTYEFVVGQLMRSVSPERYTVALSVR